MSALLTALAEWTGFRFLGSVEFFRSAGLLDLETWPIKANVFFLGAANGAFSIAAISSMFALAGQGKSAREGTRMGLWGAAQAIAFAAGGFVGTALADLARVVVGSPEIAYAAVFLLEAGAFIGAVILARAIQFDSVPTPVRPSRGPTGAGGMGISPIAQGG